MLGLNHVWYRVVEDAPHVHIAIDELEGRRIDIDADEFVVYQFDVQRFAGLMGSCLGFEPHDRCHADEAAILIGADRPMSGISIPVYIQHLRFADALLHTVDSCDGPFVFFRWKSEPIDERSRSWLQRHSSLLLTIDEIAILNDRGGINFAESAQEQLNEFRRMHLPNIDARKPGIQFPTPSGARWLQLTIRFKVDDCVQIPSIVSSRLQLSHGQFCQRLVDSELMDEEQVRGLRDRISADDARSFAEQLVADKKLTPFQATVLLEGRDIPLVLDRYVLLGEIGKGGMGAVYKALHQQMDRVVALKILPKEAVNSPEKLKRFQREMKAAAKLTHPNIVVAHDATESNGTHFLVMELVAGSDLSDVVRKQGPISCAQAVDYIAQTARGLQYAHGMGVVHRDIKPGNLLLSKKGKVKILDMGLARIDGGDPEHENNVSMELTQPGMVMGTIGYLAPEQALDTRHADARSDIYSLGCTLYYLLTGRAIYAEDTMMKTMMAHRDGAIPSLCDERDNVTVELDEIFQKMVAKQPEDRFQSMAEVISALEELDIEEEEGTQGVVAGSQAFHDTAPFIDTSRDLIEPVAAGSAKPPKRRWPLIAAGMCGLVAVLAGLIIKLQTPAGAVILEIDQPELIGAVVTIDGEKKITIQTGEGKEPIEITPDDKLHLLEVKIAGYKTFSKEFSFETGNNQTIKVRLEPLKPQIAEAKPKPRSDYNWPKDRPAPAIVPFTPEEARQHQEAWAKYLGVEVETTNSIGMKFRVIPPGEFLMGSSGEEIAELAAEPMMRHISANTLFDELPRHAVTIKKPFGFAVHEVTRGQFRQFVEATGYKTDAEKDGKGGFGIRDGKVLQSSEFLWNTRLGFEAEQNDQHPVVNVSWNDAVAFCAWLSEKEGVTYRLPTEAEWEFSCRAGNPGAYGFGSDISKLADYGWYGYHGGKNTMSVGQKAANTFGLFDMHGNVWEWCGDRFRKYEADSADAHPVSQNRVFRGGSFIHLPTYIRSAYRISGQSVYRCYNNGFRPARECEILTIDKVDREKGADSSSRYALFLDGRRANVRIPDLTFRGNHPITLECYVTPKRQGAGHQ